MCPDGGAGETLAAILLPTGTYTRRPSWVPEQSEAESGDLVSLTSTEAAIRWLWI